MDIDLGIPLFLKKAARKPSDRKVLTDQLVCKLRDAISSEQLHAGSRVTIHELCRRFNVSRTSLRKALRTLAMEGLVILSPGRSTLVAPFSRKRTDELIAIIGTLEALASELACALIDDNGAKHLRLLYQRCVDSFERKDVRAYMEADNAVRNFIFESASNRKLIDVDRTLHAQLRLPVLSGRWLPEWSKAVQERDQLVRAFEMKDASMCSLVTRRCIRHRATILRALVAGQAGP